MPPTSRHAGDTLAQQGIIRRLSPMTRLVLCMWVMDLGLAARPRRPFGSLCRYAGKNGMRTEKGTV